MAEFDIVDLSITKCRQCGGTGSYPPLTRQLCSRCRGTGADADEANLGLATTEELLYELAARFEVASVRNARHYVALIHQHLTAEELAYRTVDS